VHKSQNPDSKRKGLSRDWQYLALAECYAEAAVRLHGAREIETVCRPFFMLVAHALELSLKAVLSHQGYDEEGLMAMGHGLELCRSKAAEGGFHPSDETGLAILVDALDRPHAFQAFRYPQALRWADPGTAGVLSPLTQHLKAVKSFLGAQARPARE